LKLHNSLSAKFLSLNFLQKIIEKMSSNDEDLENANRFYRAGRLIVDIMGGAMRELFVLKWNERAQMMGGGGQVRVWDNLSPELRKKTLLDGYVEVIEYPGIHAKPKLTREDKVEVRLAPPKTTTFGTNKIKSIANILHHKKKSEKAKSDEEAISAMADVLSENLIPNAYNSFQMEIICDVTDVPVTASAPASSTAVDSNGDSTNKDLPSFELFLKKGSMVSFPPNDELFEVAEKPKLVNKNPKIYNLSLKSEGIVPDPSADPAAKGFRVCRHLKRECVRKDSVRKYLDGNHLNYDISILRALLLDSPLGLLWYRKGDLDACKKEEEELGITAASGKTKRTLDADKDEPYSCYLLPDRAENLFPAFLSLSYKRVAQVVQERNVAYGHMRECSMSATRYDECVKVCTNFMEHFFPDRQFREEVEELASWVVTDGDIEKQMVLLRKDLKRALQADDAMVQFHRVHNTLAGLQDFVAGTQDQMNAHAMRAAGDAQELMQVGNQTNEMIVQLLQTVQANHVEIIGRLQCSLPRDVEVSPGENTTATDQHVYAIDNLLAVALRIIALLPCDSQHCTILCNRVSGVITGIESLKHSEFEPASIDKLAFVLHKVEMFVEKHQSDQLTHRLWVYLNAKKKFKEYRNELSDCILGLGLDSHVGAQPSSDSDGNEPPTGGSEGAIVDDFKQFAAITGMQGMTTYQAQARLAPIVENCCNLIDAVKASAAIERDDQVIGNQRYTVEDIYKPVLEVNWDVCIGEGGFGKVYRGTYFGGDVAVKKLNLGATPTPKELRKFRNEAGISRMADNEFIIKFRGASTSDMVIVLELAHCSVADVLHRSKTIPCDNGVDSTLSEVSEIEAVLVDVCRGLAFLHLHGVVHRDIKPDNMLVVKVNSSLRPDRRCFVIKVSDFGLATHSTFSVTCSTRGGGGGFEGSAPYLAPELAPKKGVKGPSVYTPASDIYALGISGCEMIKRQKPFNDELEVYILYRTDVLGERPYEWGPNDNTRFAKLLGDSQKGCLHQSPTARPTAMHVVDVFCSGVSIDDIIVKEAVDPKLIRSDTDIRKAVAIWHKDERVAIEMYGHIIEWDVSSVTDMSQMFNDAAAFNQDLSGWVVTAVTDMSGMFRGAAAFNQDLSGWDVSSVTSMSGMFSGAAAFNQALNGWNVSSVTDMRYMFEGAKVFNQVLSGWNVSSVTDMSGMFSGADAFNQDLSGWNVSSVTSMSGMFSGAAAFNQVLNGWNVSSVTSMSGMFSGAAAFNQDLSGWNVSSVTDMSGMFRGAAAFNQVLNGWNVSSVTNMSGMFSGAATFNQDLRWWNVSSVTDMSCMFSGADVFNYDLLRWDVSSVTDMSCMFNGATAFNQNLFRWNVSSVTDMNCMFKEARSFNEVLNRWDVSSVTDMSAMFNGATTFNQDLSRWNVSSVTSMSKMFFYTTAFNRDISGWDVSSVTSMSNMFVFAAAFNQDLSGWNVSSVTNMSGMFNNATAFKQDLSGWNVSSVTNMSGMFNNATAFKQDLSGWDVSSVTDMSGMFKEARAFNQDLSGWNVSSVTDMSYMFRGATAFNQDLRWWDVSTVTHMNGMFEGGAAAFNQDLSGWNVSSVTNMSKMFEGAAAFNQDLSGWNVSSVTDMSRMFRGAAAFNQDLSGWDVSSVTNMSKMFDGAATFNQDLRWWDVSAVRDMSFMLMGATAFNQALSGLNVSSVTNMSYMFEGATAFNQDLSGWNVSSVTNMSYMFEGAAAFNQDLSGWNVSSVTDMSYMFRGASTFNQDLSGWNVSAVRDMSFMLMGARAFNQDLSGWNVSSVTNMSGMFSGARAFNQDLSGWDVSSVTDMRRMFSGAATFNQDLSGWNVSSVTDMSSMFRGAAAFNQDLNGWNVSSVTNMSYMFVGARAFNQALNGWNVSSVTNMSDMFEGAATFNQDLSGWNVSSVTNMSDMFSGAATFNQDLSGWNVSSVTNMSYMFVGARAFNQALNGWNVSSVTDMSNMFNGAKAFNQDLSGWNVSSGTDMSRMFRGAAVFNQDRRGRNVS